MEQLGVKPKTKLEGLREFQNRGWVLLDATYEPVNAHGNRSRDLVIDGDYPKLCGDLKRVLGDRWSEVPLILLKANVCKLLEPKLNKDGFKVLNKGRSVYFPGSGRSAILIGSSAKSCVETADAESFFPVAHRRDDDLDRRASQRFAP